MITELHSRHLILLLASVGLAALPHFTQLPLALTLWFLWLFGWRLFSVWRPDLLPKGAMHLVLIATGIALLYAQFDGHWGAAKGAAVFVVAVSIKLLELNKKRDAYLVCYLTWILVGSEFLFSQNLLTAIYALAVCWVALAALVAINSGNADNAMALRVAGRLLAQALPVTVLLFVLFPRIEAPTWQWLDQQKQAHTGLGDRLEPGAISDLALSPELAFRVKFNGEIPPQNQLYWRGPVFSFTDGSAWTMSKSDYVLRYQDRMRFRGKPYCYTILLEPQDRDWVYALDMPADYAASLRRNANYQLISRAKTGKAAELEIVSYPEYNTGYLTKTEYRENLQFPDSPSVRVIDLVRQLQGFDGKPEAYIDRVLDYFRRQHFNYSLHPPLMRDHFIETFLFDARTGFCNHYAAAFVYLMRTAGIPSRIVTGYQGGTYNPVGKFLEVRQANAHAWAEVWLEGRGWTRIDPTTAIVPDRIEREVNVARQVETGAVSLTRPETAQSEAGLFVFKQVLNSVDYHWQHWIVSYDTENQSLLWSRLGVDSLFKSLLWLVAAIGLIMLIFGIGMLMSRQPAEDPEVRLYRQFCRRMAKEGIQIHLGEGPHDFALRAKAQKPEMARLVDEVTRLFVQLRYGRSSSEADIRQLKKRIKAISRSMPFQFPQGKARYRK